MEAKIRRWARYVDWTTECIFDNAKDSNVDFVLCSQYLKIIIYIFWILLTILVPICLFPTHSFESFRIFLLFSLRLASVHWLQSLEVPKYHLYSSANQGYWFLAVPFLIGNLKVSILELQLDLNPPEVAVAVVAVVCPCNSAWLKWWFHLLRCLLWQHLIDSFQRVPRIFLKQQLFVVQRQHRKQALPLILLYCLLIERLS